MLNRDPVVVATFALYLVGMLALGVWAWRRTGDLADYLLGGRSLGRWVTALSAGASDMSGWLLLGLPGYAYLSGFEAGWIAIGLLAGTWLNWRLVARRLRILTERYANALTLGDYLERRFADDSRLLRVISAVLVLLFFTFYASSGLVAGGKLFESVFGLPYLSAVALGTAVILSYTLLGGFLAVSWTDLVQGLLMAVALVLVPAAAMLELGGWGNLTAAMGASAPGLLDAWSSRDGQPLGGIAILSLLGWGLGYFGQPHILARFMAIRDPDQLGAARRIATGWVSLGLGGALLAGFAGIGVLPTTLTGADSEKVFLELVQYLLHPVPAGICLAAVLAAIMSTADSQLLVASSSLSEDLYKRFWRPQASDAELLRVGRLTVAGIAALAFSLALDRDSKVLELVAYAWAGFGAAFGPVILFSLFWGRMGRVAAAAGMLTGGVVVVVWKQLSGGWFDVYELVPGFVLSSLAITLAGYLAPAPAAVRDAWREALAAR
ncbi:MAG: sodium/proline symporter PutP [Gammaproteobacteria bacterium]|nr:sodium/proline symporter PutP [Gammaproteobacteria bacterium]